MTVRELTVVSSLERFINYTQRKGVQTMHKIIMTVMKMTALAIVAVILLCGCAATNESNEGTSQATVGGNSENESNGNDATDDGDGSLSGVENAVAAGEYFYYEGTAIEGQLKFKVQSTACYTNITDAGLSYRDLEEVTDQVVVPETGELVSNYTFVMIELYVENIDAVPSENWRFSDDITFRMDILNLVNTSELSDNNSDYTNYYINYFSESDECSEHYLAFKLEQGESRVLTIGCIAYTDDIDSLYLCTTTGAKDSTFAALDLSFAD